MNNSIATRMADLARDLRSQRSSVATMRHVVAATAELVKNCDDVAVTVVTGGEVVTRASIAGGTAGAIAERADQLQSDHEQGPCRDAAWDTAVVRIGDLRSDERWSSWASAVADELGARAYLCVQLFTHEQHELGTLQLFSREPDAFDDDAVDEVQGIAAHAAVALGAAENLEAMQFGLVRRTMIGQATGILMERYGLDQHQAFEVLRRTSQETGTKVYALAIDLVNGRRPANL